MKKIIAIFLVTIGILSCDLGNEPEIQGTKIQEMCGEWYIEVFDENGALAAAGYHLITTSNTASNTETDMMLDDHELWPCKVKCQVNYAGRSIIAASALSNEYNESIGVSIKEGKIIKDVATTTGGNKSDSIYIKLEFEDDPGHDYIYAGYKRTGFLEDEH